MAIEELKKDDEDALQVEIEDDNLHEKKDTRNDIEKRLDEIDIRLQELDVLYDDLEFKMTLEDGFDKYYNNYQKIKEEIKSLEKERKELRKANKVNEEKTALDQVSIWVICYGVIITLICLPIVSYNIWLEFSLWLIGALENVLGLVSSSNKVLMYIVYGLIIYSLPLLMHLVSWELYLNFIKNEIDRKLFIIIWIIQGILTLGLMIYMGITLFPDLV